MTANDEINGWTRALIMLCVALVGSALTVVVVRRDVLTGRAPAVTRTAEPCTVPQVEPDLAPVIPNRALDVVFGLLPMLPLPNLGPVRQLDFNQYVSAEQYAHFSDTPLDTHTRSMLEGNGFVRADSIGYEAGETFFGAEALQTGSPAQAAALARDLLADACRAGVATELRSLVGVPGGVTFVYHDWDMPPFRATFLVGDTVMRLNVCLCVENRGDPFVVLDNWARAVNARMRDYT